jgi:hypothetical protein
MSGPGHYRDGMDIIAEIQREQQIVNAAYVRAEELGQRPPASGMPGLEEWRRQVLRDAGETHTILRGERIPL